MTQADQILAALHRSGALTVAEIVATGSAPSGSISRACGVLVEKRILVRVSGGGRGKPSAYAIRQGSEAHQPLFRGDVAQRAQADYVTARKAGVCRHEAAARFDLTQSAGLRFEETFRLETCTISTFDSSCPKFANDDEHLGQIADLGFFPVLPRLAELRAAHGR